MNSKSYLPYKKFNNRNITEFDKHIIKKLYKYLNVRAIAYILGIDEEAISAFAIVNKLKKTNNKELVKMFNDIPVIVIDKRRNYDK